MRKELTIVYVGGYCRTLLSFRATRLSDIDAPFEVRARTRQNPFSREDLAQLEQYHQLDRMTFAS